MNIEILSGFDDCLIRIIVYAGVKYKAQSPKYKVQSPKPKPKPPSFSPHSPLSSPSDLQSSSRAAVTAASDAYIIRIKLLTMSGYDFDELAVALS